jgi:NADH:ubiquinone oxidoreductase subunit H
MLALPMRDIFDVLIILIPFVVFLVGIFTAGWPMSYRNEDWVFRTNYANVAVVLIFPLILWASSRINLHNEFLLLITVSTIFMLLTFYDWWVSDDKFSIIKHFRTVFQTISITVVIIALKMYYHDRIAAKKEGFNVPEDDTEDFLTNL